MMINRYLVQAQIQVFALQLCSDKEPQEFSDFISISLTKI